MMELKVNVPKVRSYINERELLLPFYLLKNTAECSCKTLKIDLQNPVHITFINFYLIAA